MRRDGSGQKAVMTWVDHRPRFPDRPVRHRGCDQVSFRGRCPRVPHIAAGNQAVSAHRRALVNSLLPASMASVLLRKGRASPARIRRDSG